MTGNNNMASHPPAIVMGLSPTGLYAVRELARAGIPIVGVAGQRQVGQSSKFLQDTIVIDDHSMLLDEMCNRFASVQAKPVLIPTSDEYIEFIAQNNARLATVFQFQKSYADGIAAKVLEKETFYELCDKHGVVYPKLVSVATADILSCADQVEFPCMIKPSLIHEIKHKMAGEKGWVVRDAQEFPSIAKNIPPEAGQLLVQEIVPGPESEITLYCGYLDESGGVHQPFTSRKLRQYPPGFGSASLVQSNPEPDSQEIAERLLKAIGYCGIAAAEFKRDPRTGQLKIIEINARPSLWFSASTAADKSVVLAAYHDLADTGETVDDTPQRQGVRWRYASKDLWSQIFYKRTPSFILPAPDIEAAGPAQAKTNAVYASDDPKPAFSELLLFARKAFDRLMGARRDR